MVTINDFGVGYLVQDLPFGGIKVLPSSSFKTRLLVAYNHIQSLLYSIAVCCVLLWTDECLSYSRNQVLGVSMARKDCGTFVTWNLLSLIDFPFELAHLVLHSTFTNNLWLLLLLCINTFHHTMPSLALAPSHFGTRPNIFPSWHLELVLHTHTTTLTGTAWPPSHASSRSNQLVLTHPLSNTHNLFRRPI